ncbi:Hypothetical protein PBC10988_29100 [Planctomycetales bacterium 10988]|nr:Hypothetical protein PBC10988_29100 [Planctomycetales bacterium 10988]
MTVEFQPLLLPENWQANSEDWLDEVLSLWELAAKQGKDLTPQEICPNGSEEFFAEAAEAIRCLKKFDQHFEAEDASQSLFQTEDFEVNEVIGEGGQAVVFLGKDLQLGRQVAIKVSKAQASRSQQRLVQEAQIASTLEHPGVIPVYEFGRNRQQHPFYVMRFVPRKDRLQDAIEAAHAIADSAERTLAFQRLLQDFVTVCRTIEYAHSKQVIHRDLKPSNILLGEYGEVFVIDFGIAKAVSDGTTPSGNEPNSVTCPAEKNDLRTYGPVGTPAYMSPEQAGSSANIGKASDIYGLGATLYHLITGTPPFLEPTKQTANTTLGMSAYQAESDTRSQEMATESMDRIPADPLRLLDRVKAGDLSKPRSLLPTIHRPLEAICLKAMHIDPQQRYSSAEALAIEIERYLADEPITAWQEPPHERVRRWMKRHRTLVTTGSVAMMVALVALSIASILLQVANREKEQARQQAEFQREVAEEQREIAEVERDRARTAKAEETRRAEELQRLLYVTQIRSAANALNEANTSQARQLLDASRESSRGFEWKYLFRRSVLPTEMLNVDYQSPTQLSLSGDGRYLAIAGDRAINDALDLFQEKGTFTVYDLDTQKVLFEWTPKDEDQDLNFFDPAFNDPFYESAIESLTLSPDGSKAAVVNRSGGALAVWNPKTRQQLWTASSVESACFMDGGTTLLAIKPLSQGKTELIYFQAETGEQLRTQDGPQMIGRVRIDHSADGAYSAWVRSPYVEDRSPRVTLIENSTGKVQSVLATDPRLFIRQVAFDPGNQWVALSSETNTASIFQVEKGISVGSVSIQGGTIGSVCFSPQDQTLATAGNDRTIRLWKLTEKKQLLGSSLESNLKGTFRVYDNEVRSLAFANQGKELFSFGEDAAVRRWMVEEVAPPPFELPGKMIPSSDGSICQFLLSQKGKELKRWKKSFTGEPDSFPFPPQLSEPFAVDWQTKAVAGIGKNGLEVISLENQKPIFASTDITKPFCFMPDGRMIIAYDKKNPSIVGIELPSGKLAFRFQGKYEHIALDAKGTTLAASHQNHVTLWDLATFKEEIKIPTGQDSIRSLALSPDSQWLATGGKEAKIKIWNPRTAQNIAILERHRQPVTTLSFDSRGKRLLTGSEDKSVQLWDTGNWMHLLTFDDLELPIQRVQFTPDSQAIVATGANTLQTKSLVWSSSSIDPK